MVANRPHLQRERMHVFGWMYKLSRWILGGIFVYAGSVKLLEPKIFAVLIEAYGILPENLLMPVAVVLPVLEVAAGIGLLFDVEGSLSVVAALLGLFIVILGYGIWMGLDLDCGCFGLEDPESEAFHGLKISLYRDVAMLLGIVLLYSWRHRYGIKPVKLTLFINEFLKRRRTKHARF